MPWLRPVPGSVGPTWSSPSAAVWSPTWPGSPRPPSTAGTAYINVATTLLAQVDAAIGGKTGVNLPEGKNLVGAFWQPAAVICDTEVLSSLPPREWASGRGEMAKYAFLGGPRTGDGPDASLLELPLAEQVARCVAIKADVVASDEREGDRRMVLNYGHTLAHALEARPSSPAAVSTCVTVRRWPSAWCSPPCWPAGSDASTTVGWKLHRRVVGGFDLPAVVPAGVDPDSWCSFMARDKKAQHDLTFILDGAKGVEVVRGVDEADVLATLAEMQDRNRADADQRRRD